MKKHIISPSSEPEKEGDKAIEGEEKKYWDLGVNQRVEIVETPEEYKRLVNEMDFTNRELFMQSLTKIFSFNKEESDTFAWILTMWDIKHVIAEHQVVLYKDMQSQSSIITGYTEDEVKEIATQFLRLGDKAYWNDGFDKWWAGAKLNKDNKK